MIHILILYPNHNCWLGLDHCHLSYRGQHNSKAAYRYLHCSWYWHMGHDLTMTCAPVTRLWSDPINTREEGRYRPLNGQLIIHSSGSRKGIMRIIRNLDPETLSHSDCHKHILKSLKMTQNLITFNVRQKNYYRVQLLLIDANVPGRSAETWSLVSPSVSQNYLSLVACSLHKRCQMRICLSMVADL